MASSDIQLHFTIHYGEPTGGIQEILYEFITNALDAHTANPEVSVVGNKIVIADMGKGITIEDLNRFGSTDGRSVSRHGSHGTGLKDAIACSVRNGINICIETVRNTFTFQKCATNKYVELQVKPNGVLLGTTVSITSSNPAQDFAKITNRFLFMMKPKPALLDSKNPLVEVYAASLGRGAVMMMGVKKDGHPSLDKIYNFKQPTVPQKDSFSRNHAFMNKSFKNNFRKKIAKANPDERFGVRIKAPAPKPKPIAPLPVPLPAPRQVVNPAPTVSPAYSEPRTVQGDVAIDLDTHCMVQDYHVWTLASADRDATRAVATNLVNFLRNISGISISATIEQGSLTKNTFVPLSSDIDIVVEIVDFHDQEMDKSNDLKQELREHGCRMEDSGHNILNFSFQGVDFDLVLIDAAKIDDRSKRIALQCAQTKTIVAPEHNDRLKLQSFIRAVKYWSKRQNAAIKSCSLEMVVLALWPVLTAPSTTHPFRHFLRNVRAELNNPAIKDYYELSASSIDDIAAKASATLALLNSIV